MKQLIISLVLLWTIAGLSSVQANTSTTITVKPGANTLQEAINKAATLSGDVVIELLSGDYRTNKGYVVRGGNWSSLLITARQGHEVSLTGDVVIPKSRVKTITDPQLLKRLPREAHGKAVSVDCRGLVDSLSNIRPSGFGRKSLPSWSELMVDGKPLTIARWPNDSMQLIGKIEVSGGPKDKEAGRLPVFHYSGNRPQRWADISNMWIGGYFGHGYADDLISVKSINTADSTIHAGMFTTYQFFTGADFRRWYAANLIEELDREGEFVIDPARLTFYFFPRQKKISQLRLTVLESPVIAIENCRNVTLRGLTIENSRGIGVYMDNTHHVLVEQCTLRNLGNVAICVGKGTDSPLNATLRPHAMEAGGQLKGRMVGDMMGRIYEDTMLDREAGDFNGVRDCYIYQVGAGGVSLGGGNRATLTPSHNFVENCRISDYNRIERSYRPAVWIDGVGNRVSGCSIFNAPSMAILFHGNNHLIERCDITHVCQEVDDQGAIYYGRDPSERGHVIRYNYFHQLSPRHRVTATYHDDGACGSEVYGNIYYKAGSLPVLIGGGMDHHYHGNLFIDSPVAFHVDNRLQNWAANMVAKGGIYKKRLNAVHYNQPPYSTAYPELARYWEDNPPLPKRNLIEGNLLYRIPTVLRGSYKWCDWQNNWTTTIDPGLVDAEDPLKGFTPNARIYDMLPEVRQIPFDKIGSTLPARE